MSSQPSKDPAPRKRVPFEKWRKVMLAGALILLVGALADALMEGTPPRGLSLLIAFVGYGLLAAGFGIRMRAVKEARSRSTENEENQQAERES